MSLALFYGTPVLYTLDRVGHTMRDVIALNPLTPILVLAHRWVIDPHAPGLGAAVGGTLRLLVPAAIYIGLCLLAAWVFRREAPRIAEEL